MEHLVHMIAPVYDKRSRYLILGTMPSPKSREVNFFYGNKQIRFWKILAAVFGEAIGESREEKVSFLLKNYIALWDVIAECDIEGASDSSIKNVVPNDFSVLFQKTNITKIYTTGKTAYQLYQTLCFPKYGIPAEYLPSPSPANCAKRFEEMVSMYQVLSE